MKKTACGITTLACFLWLAEQSWAKCPELLIQWDLSLSGIVADDGGDVDPAIRAWGSQSGYMEQTGGGGMEIRLKDPSWTLVGYLEL